MAIFKKRYPSKQGVSEASVNLARETTMRQGRERAVAHINHHRKINEAVSNSKINVLETPRLFKFLQ